MATFIYCSAIVLFLFLGTYDSLAAGDRRLPAYQSRMLAYSAGALLSVCFLLSGPEKTGGLMSVLTVSEALVLAAPCSYGNQVRTFAYSIAFAGICLVLVACGMVLGWLEGAASRLLHSGIILFALVFTLCILLTFSVGRFGNLELLTDENVLQHGLELCSKLVHGGIFIAILASSCALRDLPVPGSPQSLLFPLLLLLHFLVLVSASRSGHSFLVPVKVEEEIRLLNKGQDEGEEEPSAQDTRLKVLYARIIAYMEKEQPFLDQEFSMQRMSRDLYSNKLYLSKAINTLSHKNFRQFVNFYRVEYAKNLFRQDPRLRINEAADMSGFHSVVSFNMAFKLNTGQTPSEWLHVNLFS
ncbi:MAG: helix-turn-helix domain-containing protein [Candidatus Cryptobacteroides sp.]